MSAKTFVYVFSADGTFLKLDRATLTVAGQGSLREADIYLVRGIIPDPERRDLLIQTTRIWSPDTRPAQGLVVVRPSSGTSTALSAAHTISPPSGTDQLIGAIMIPGDRRMLVATWNGPPEKTPAPTTLAIAGNGNSRDAKRVENFMVGPGSCVTPDRSQVLTSTSRILPDIRALDARDLSVRTLQSKPLDMGAFSAIALAVSRNPCRLLVVGRSRKPSPDTREVPAYLFDMESRRIVRTLTFPERGEYSLSPDGTLVVVDERIIVPNVLPSGRTVGVRYQKTGVVRVYDAVTGAETGAARLPEGGELSAIDGSTGYYISPGLLSVVDLRTAKITATAKLPFASGFVAFHDER